MDVNDDAYNLNKRAVFEFIASKLAPTMTSITPNAKIATCSNVRLGRCCKLRFVCGNPLRVTRANQA